MRGLFMVLFVSIFAGIVFGLQSQPGRSIGFGLGVFAGGCLILGVVLTIRLLRGFTVPLDLLSDLDSTSAQSMGRTEAGAATRPT